MQNQDTTGGDNDAQDRNTQGIVLIHVITLHPITVRLSEIVRELTMNSGEFVDRDRIERAVGDLVAVGLLYRCEAVVLPTRAALHFNEVLGG